MVLFLMKVFGFLVDAHSTKRIFQKKRSPRWQAELDQAGRLHRRRSSRQVFETGYYVDGNLHSKVKNHLLEKTAQILPCYTVWHSTRLEEDTLRGR